MAIYFTKLGKFYVERSPKKDVLNLGVESRYGSGFYSIPCGKSDLLHAASILGAALALRGVNGRKRTLARAQRAVDRRQAQARRSPDFGKKGGFGGGKRVRKRR